MAERSKHIFPNGEAKPHTLTDEAKVEGGTLTYPGPTMPVDAPTGDMIDRIGVLDAVAARHGQHPRELTLANLHRQGSIV